MSDEIMLVFGEDGVAREYDDTWDITIHCESEEEQKAVLEKLNNSNQEAQELSKNSPKLDKENGDLQPTCNELATDTISRQAAIALANSLKDDLPDDERMVDAVMAHNEGIMEYQTKLSLLPSAQPEPLVKESRTLVKDLVKDTISRQATIDALVKAIRKDPYYDTIMRAERRTDDL